jgi:hypothetical protein
MICGKKEAFMRKILMIMPVVALVTAPAMAALPFHDDFESGMGNWTKVPGAAETLQLTGPDPWKSIDPGPWGVHEGYSARQHAYVGGGNGYASYHNFGDEAGFIKAEVYMFEDYTTSQDPVQAAMTITPDNASGEPDFADFLRIGVLQWSGTNAYYSCRTAADGHYTTAVARKNGWTKFGIEMDAGAGGGVRFYIDDNLVWTSSRTVDDLSCITLGFNSSNYENFWYDGVNITPEPASALLLLLAVPALARRKRF